MRYNRPPFMLVLPGDNSGCSWHRLHRPLEILSRNGVCAGRSDSTFRSDAELKALNPQVIIFQRQSDPGQVQEIQRYRAALPKAFTIWEVDDALSAVPDKSWHAPYMTPNIDARIHEATKHVHCITTSTQDLVEHLSGICQPGTKIRLVPNELGRDDIEKALIVRRQAPANPANGKLRVGWGGGVGHIGDLEMLNPVFLELKDEVEWFFLGMNPTIPESVHKTFMGAATTQDYLVALAAMNLDLMIAPLEDNLFNRCKSNLRLLEGGACFYPTICSPVSPYFTDNPPIVGYANTTAEWVEQIRAFATLPESDRRKHGERLHDWVVGRYVMDDHPEKRLLSWLPDHARAFKPKLTRSKGTGLSIVTTGDDLYARFNTSEDILYVRPGTYIPEDALERIKASDGDIVIPLSNDGGPWGFPNITALTPVDPLAIGQINSAAVSINHKPIELVAGSGPVVLLRRSALEAIGMPDVDSLSVEVAILEWTVCAKSRGLAINLLPTVFVGAQGPCQPNPGETEFAGQRINMRWPQNQFDDTELRTFREKLELVFHRDNYTVLPPQNRSDYAQWAAIADEAGPKVVQAANASLRDASIAHFGYPCDNPKAFHDPSVHPSWLFFTPKTATISPLWAAHLTHVTNTNPSALVVYADHDYLGPEGQRISPDFKPNFDAHMLVSRDYVTQAIAVRADLLEGLGHIDESSLYKLVLDTVEGHGRDVVVHCPRVLAHLQLPDGKETPEYLTQQLAAARDFAERLGIEGEITPHPVFTGLREVSYASKTHHPMVHIIIPTKDRVDLIAPAVATILKMTTYPNYDITVIDNGTTAQDALDWFIKIQADTFLKVKVLRLEETFNFSRFNNWAVEQIHAEDDSILVFLNDDTRVISPCWLSELAGGASLPSVGAVGAKLVFPHGLFQHMGIFVHHEHIGHACKGIPLNNPGMGAYCITSHEATAVTGACMALRTNLFKFVGGFDETLANNFNDVALCNKIRALGLINIVCAKSELQHMEGQSRSVHLTPQVAQQLFLDLQVYKSKFGTKNAQEQFVLPADPYWNPNLALFNAPVPYPLIGGADMNVFQFPPPPVPWEHPKREKILLFGPEAPLSNEIKDGAAIYRLATQGNQCSIPFPPMQNCGPWDIRDPVKAAERFKDLALDRIILTNLGDAPLQLLDFLSRLNTPVEYRPYNVEALCPRGNMLVGDKLCDKGYAKGACVACLKTNGSLQGNPRMDSWLMAWFDFFGACEKVDLSFIQKIPEFFEAFDFVFGMEKEEQPEPAKIYTIPSSSDHFWSPPPCDVEPSI